MALNTINKLLVPKFLSLARSLPSTPGSLSNCLFDGSILMTNGHSISTYGKRNSWFPGPYLFCLPYLIKRQLILLVAQGKVLELRLILLFPSHPSSKLTSISVSSTFKIYPNHVHISPLPCSPSTWSCPPLSPAWTISLVSLLLTPPAPPPLCPPELIKKDPPQDLSLWNFRIWGTKRFY